VGRQGERDPPLPGLPAAARAAHRPYRGAGRAAQHFGLDGGVAAVGPDPDRDDERRRHPAASGDLRYLTGLAGRAQRGQHVRQRPAQRVVYVLGPRRGLRPVGSAVHRDDKRVGVDQMGGGVRDAQRRAHGFDASASLTLRRWGLGATGCGGSGPVSGGR
jgi:hypothetical protein